MTDDGRRIRLGDECPVVVFIDKWSKFSQKVNECVGEFLTGRFVFRGQRDSGFRLESSFDRRYGKLSVDRRRTIESNLLAYYREAVARQELWPHQEMREVEEVILATGQHFGLPTRWLDWTDSRYIAAFFAFAGLEDHYLSHADAAEESEDRRVAIFALDIASPVLDQERLRLIQPKFTEQNPRMTAQLGLFVQNRTLKASIEECILEYMDGNADDVVAPPLYRFDLPVREARIALRDLAEMGISYSRLFPGLEGAAREAKMDDWLGTPVPRSRE